MLRDERKAFIAILQYIFNHNYLAVIAEQPVYSFSLLVLCDPKNSFSLSYYSYSGNQELYLCSL
jgi:hypothetical protein